MPRPNDVTRYGYDLMGRPTSITYPSGAIARYAYHRGKVRSLTVEPAAGPTVNVATDIEHQPFGGLRGWTYGNGLKRLQGYDLDGRLMAISVTAGATVQQSLTYAWTANDQIEAMTNGADATQSHRYEYDELGRLVGDFIGGATVGSRDGFDAVGNRISRGSTGPGAMPSLTYAISPQSNRMDGQAGNANRIFGYSPTGQLTSSSGWQGQRAYGYDAFDRLESANVEGAVTRYVVNALDQRMTKAGALGSHRYAYAGQNTLLGEHSASGWKNYLYLGGAPVAVVQPDNTVHFIHTDHLGRPESATGADRTTSWRAVNLSYHRTVALDTIGGISLGFPGQTWDEETGTWHNGFRDYDPHTGRYIQSDPIGLGGGVNTYAYVRGNPISLVDPLGLRDCVCGSKTNKLAVRDSTYSPDDAVNANTANSNAMTSMTGTAGLLAATFGPQSRAASVAIGAGLTYFALNYQPVTIRAGDRWVFETWSSPTGHHTSGTLFDKDGAVKDELDYEACY